MHIFKLKIDNLYVCSELPTIKLFPINYLLASTKSVDWSYHHHILFMVLCPHLFDKSPSVKSCKITAILFGSMLPNLKGL